MTERLTSAETPPFAFGQTVYVARATPYKEERVPCPICFGKKVIRLELGNGEMQPFECDMCGKGWEQATGFVTRGVPFSEVTSGQVVGLVQSDEGWIVKVNGWDHSPRDRDVFATIEEAEARRAEMHKEAEQQAQRNFENQFKSKAKEGGWKVGYHKREIADCERKIAWHRARLGESR